MSVFHHSFCLQYIDHMMGTEQAGVIQDPDPILRVWPLRFIAEGRRSRRRASDLFDVMLDRGVKLTSVID